MQTQLSQAQSELQQKKDNKLATEQQLEAQGAAHTKALQQLQTQLSQAQSEVQQEKGKAPPEPTVDAEEVSRLNSEVQQLQTQLSQAQSELQRKQSKFTEQQNQLAMAEAKLALIDEQRQRGGGGDDARQEVCVSVVCGWV